MKLFAPIHSCFLVSSLASPESLIARGELSVELAEDMDAVAEVAGVGGSVQGIPGQGFDLHELAFIFFRAVHGDDHGAAVVADAFWVDVCAAEGGFDDGGFLGVGEGRERSIFSPGLPALRGIIEERLNRGVGPALHVAVDVPEIDHGCKRHPEACAGKLLHSDCILSARTAHERDPDDLGAMRGELDYCGCGH